MERVTQLIARSERVYDSIDQIIDNETVARRRLRLGINATAQAMKDGATPSQAGELLLTMSSQLDNIPGPLDNLANEYADVQRATVDRQGLLETDARHTIHLLDLSIPYALEHYPRLDIGRVALYTLWHDMPEARAGDVTSLGITPERRQQKELAEAQAIQSLKLEYGEEWPQVFEVLEQYEELQELEAMFVKSKDKIDPAYTHLESGGSQLKGPLYSFNRDTFLAAIDQGTQQMLPYASEFPLIINDRGELNRRVAMIAFPEAA